MVLQQGAGFANTTTNKVKTHAPAPGGAGKHRAGGVEMGHRQAMAVMLDWFQNGDIDLWNFCVLERGMLGHERPRDRGEVERSLGWAWVKNNAGRDVYIRPARGASWPIVFLDDLPPRKARGIAAKYAALVIETSANNCQVWICVGRPLSESERSIVQRSLVARVGADPASVSGDHFGRAVGYRNRKSGRNDFTVRVLAATDGAALDPSLHLIQAPAAPPPGVGPCVFTPYASESESESEKEFRYCLARLGWARSRGRDPSGEVDFLIANLADRAIERGKRKRRADAVEYAKKTVQRAMAMQNAG